MHAHFHNNLNAQATISLLAAKDFVNNNPGSPAAPGATVLADDNGAALVDDNGNALDIN